MNVLVLNSAHGKYPMGSDGWIQATMRAMRALARPGVEFLCSTEPLQWDLVTYLAGLSGVPVRLIMKHGGDACDTGEYERLKTGFGLDDRHTTPMYLAAESVSARHHPKDLWQERDRAAVGAADEIYPVSLRPHGRLDSLLGEPAYRGKVRNDFRVPWSPNNFIPRYSLDGRSWRKLPDGEWLVHWTRSNSGKWPGERDADFFRDLLADGSRYVRDAGSTLRRILDERRIRGSSWRMPGGAKAVSFSALSPGGAIELMRWRARYVRMSFEPYGVAVERNVLEELGAREVNYTDERMCEYTADERLFMQSSGEKGLWTREREWRLPGDLDLSKLTERSVRIVAPDAYAAESINCGLECEFPIHVLFDG